MSNFFMKSFESSWLCNAIKHLNVFRDYLTPRKIRHRRKSLSFYSQFIGKNELCFDVGANTGNRTKIFLELGAKIVCIEPQESCLQVLNKLFKNYKEIIIVDKAVGDREGFEELSICEEEPTISTMSKKWMDEGRFSKDCRWAKTQKVAVTTLDALIQLYGRPKFCKIDVEGYEKSALKGLTNPISYISFEFTVEFIDDAKDCINHLLSIGSVDFNCSIAESMELLFVRWVAPDELYKKLASIEDKLLWGDIYARFL